MLRLKENFLQTICLCRNLGKFDSACEKRSGISLTHSYVTLFEHTTCVTSKNKTKNAAYAICHRRRVLTVRWCNYAALAGRESWVGVFLLFFFLHGALTWRVLTAPLWTPSLPSSLSPDIYHSLQLPPLTPVKHLLATYAHLINVYSTL